MSADSLATQGDQLAAQWEHDADPLVAALTGAINHNRTVEYASDHPSHRGANDVTLEPGERYTDDMQGHGSHLVTSRPGDSLEAGLADALGLTMPTKLKPIGR